MNAERQLLIVGGGLTAHAAALSARASGYPGAITIIGEEPHRPYDRTPLSKAVMQGKREPDSLYFASPDQYREQRIQLLTGVRCESIDTRDRSAMFSTGGRLLWDELLIATGASPIRLPESGSQLNGVHYLRTIPDAESIRNDLERSQHLIVIGGGFIGSEIAASARMLGKQVTLIDLASTPLGIALGPELGDICASIHREQDVDLNPETRVVALEGDGQVQQVIAGDGRTFECDLVVVGIGVRPDVGIVSGSDIKEDNGILVDGFCRASVSGVYAAGDVARWWHPRYRQSIRVEHFDNAGAQGAAAGKAIAGTLDAPYAPVPYFWSDQYDTNIQYVGHHDASCEVLVRRYPEKHQAIGFYVRDSRVEAAATINRPRELRSVRRLVEAGATIGPEVLLDPEADLRALSREFR